MIDLSDLLLAGPAILITAAISALLIAILAFALDAGTRWRLEWMDGLFILTPLIMVVSILMTQRIVYPEGSPEWLLTSTDDDQAVWPSRIANFLCVAIAVERGLRFLLKGEYRQAKGWGLLWALMAYIISVNLIASVLGSEGGFTHKLVYAPLIAVAVFAYAQNSLNRCIHITRNSLFVFMLAGLMLLPVKPEFVADTRYATGIIPGFHLRYYSFATHPNSLAPMCLLLLSTLRLAPYRQRWLTVAAAASAVISLLLTQSKTSVALVGGGFLLLFAVDYVANAPKKSVMASQNRSIGVIVLMLGSVFAAGVAAVLALMLNPMLLDRVNSLMDRMQLTTLTGRTAIWAATLDAAKDNPLFGYGPTLWGVEFRMRVGIFVAHSHSQFLQAYGEAGYVGLLSLLVYIFTLLVACWKVRKETRGVSVLLAAFVVLRGFTEVPLLVAGVLQPEFMMQMFILVLCAAYYPPASAPAVQRSRGIGKAKLDRSRLIQAGKGA